MSAISPVFHPLVLMLESLGVKVEVLVVDSEMAVSVVVEGAEVAEAEVEVEVGEEALEVWEESAEPEAILGFSQ